MGRDDDVLGRLRRIAMVLMAVIIVADCGLLLLGLDVEGPTSGPSPLIAAQGASALRGVLRIAGSVCKAGGVCCLVYHAFLRLRGNGR